MSGGHVGVGDRVHPGDQLAQGVGDDEVLPVLLERLHRPGRALADRALEQQPDVLAGEVGVLLGAGERELLLDDLLGQHEPRVVPAGPAQVAQRAEGVEAREVRRRQPAARRVQPQRRRAGQDPDAVVLPDRVPVAQPLDVVPHPVRVDHPGAGRLGDAEHPAVDVGRYAGDHRARRRAEPGRPGLADQVVVAADAAAGDDHRLGAQLEVADLVAVGGPAALGAVRRAACGPGRRRRCRRRRPARRRGAGTAA